MSRGGSLKGERRDLTRRESLYRDSITAASKAYGEAVVSNEASVPSSRFLARVLPGAKPAPFPAFIEPCIAT